MIVKAIVNSLAYVAENGEHYSTRKNICATSWVKGSACGVFKNDRRIYSDKGHVSHTKKPANTATSDSTCNGAGVEPILGGMVLGVLILEDGTSCR